MKQYYEVIAVSSDNQALKKVGDKEGVRTFCVEMTRKITPIKDLYAVWKLYRLFRKEKPYIVHTHTPKAGTVGMIAAWLAKVPNRLHTVAGLPLLEARGSKRKLLDIVEVITYKCCTLVLPNSFGLKEIILKEKLCNISKIKVIGNGSSNGINTSYFDSSLFTKEQRDRLKNELNINDDDFVFIFVGRLVGDKGINELIEAFDKISDNYQQVKLLLVGPLEADLDPLKKETIEKIEQKKSIISVGYQSDVRYYFSISNALVFPSYREGFPNVVMQAGAMGLPSIVTDINGCNEIIINDKNGTIIPVKDSGAIYKEMELFLINKDYVSELRENARDLIMSRYEQSLVWKSLLEEYKLLDKEN